MELLSLETVADLLGVCTKTVRKMVKQGDLEAEYRNDGKKGRPNMMITSSSYGKFYSNRKGKRGIK